MDDSTLDLALQEIMDIADKVLHAHRGGKVRQNKKRHHDQSAVELEQLEIGDQVVIQDPKTSTWSNKGLITDIRDRGKSYIVDLLSFWRSLDKKQTSNSAK